MQILLRGNIEEYFFFQIIFIDLYGNFIQSFQREK
jgi:hypothetical protein